MKVHKMFIIAKHNLEANGISIRVHGKDNLGVKPCGKVVADLSETTSQDFEISFTRKLAAKIEKSLLEKNQHLTQVQLVVQKSQ